MVVRARMAAAGEIAEDPLRADGPRHHRTGAEHPRAHRPVDRAGPRGLPGRAPGRVPERLHLLLHVPGRGLGPGGRGHRRRSSASGSTRSGERRWTPASRPISRRPTAWTWAGGIASGWIAPSSRRADARSTRSGRSRAGGIPRTASRIAGRTSSVREPAWKSRPMASGSSSTGRSARGWPSPARWPRSNTASSNWSGPTGSSPRIRRWRRPGAAAPVHSRPRPGRASSPARGPRSSTGSSRRCIGRPSSISKGEREGGIEARLRHRQDPDRPSDLLPDRARQLLAVGRERQRRRGQGRPAADAPGPGPRGRQPRQEDEGAEHPLPVVEALVPPPAVPLLPPCLPAAGRGDGLAGRAVARPGRLAARCVSRLSGRTRTGA